MTDQILYIPIITPLLPQLVIVIYLGGNRSQSHNNTRPIVKPGMVSHKAP